MSDEVQMTLHRLQKKHDEHEQMLERHSAVMDRHAEILGIHGEIISSMKQTSEETRDATVAMKGILETWNDTRGFFRIMKVMGNVMRWLALVGAAIGALVYFIKTGTWR